MKEPKSDENKLERDWERKRAGTYLLTCGRARSREGVAPAGAPNSSLATAMAAVGLPLPKLCALHDSVLLTDSP